MSSNCVGCGARPNEIHASNCPAVSFGEPEMVDHPAHYGGGDNPYEVIKVIRAWAAQNPNIGFALGSALKYIGRAGMKEPDKLVEDLKKAVWYIEDEIKALEEA